MMFCQLLYLFCHCSGFFLKIMFISKMHDWMRTFICVEKEKQSAKRMTSVSILLPYSSEHLYRTPQCNAPLCGAVVHRSSRKPHLSLAFLPRMHAGMEWWIRWHLYNYTCSPALYITAVCSTEASFLLSMMFYMPVKHRCQTYGPHTCLI